MKSAIVTGGAGFAGVSLVEELLKNGYNVLCVLRPGSGHNERISKIETDLPSYKIPGQLSQIELDMWELSSLPLILKDSSHWNLKGSVFFHLAWVGGRDDLEVQYKNVDAALSAVEASSLLGCRRIVITGSQAEYGIKSGITKEDNCPEPFSAYGAAKTAALYLTKRKAEILGIEWIWGRIYSLYGRYEPEKTMLQYLISCLKQGKSPKLSSCMQYWDYLEAGEAGKAIISLAEKGKSGEIYNIAHGNYRILKEFVEIVHERVAPEIPIIYGDKEEATTVSLMPSVEKIHADTGWKAALSFPEGLGI